MITIPLSKQGKNAGKYEAIVDDCDSDLENFRWMCRIEGHNLVYAARSDPNNNDIKHTMHRIILERVLGRKLKRDEEVGHINENSLDNRRGNLRLATRSQTLMNSNRYKTNKAGFKGVSNRNGRYRSVIHMNGKQIHLGYFNTPEEAHAAYCEAAKEHFGEFANEG